MKDKGEREYAPGVGDFIWILLSIIYCKKVVVLEIGLLHVLCVFWILICNFQIKFFSHLCHQILKILYPQKPFFNTFQQSWKVLKNGFPTKLESVYAFGLSVCLSVCPSVCLSAL